MGTLFAEIAPQEYVPRKRAKPLILKCFGTFLEPFPFNSASSFSSIVFLPSTTFQTLSSGLSWPFGLAFWSLFGAMILQFGVEVRFCCLVALCNVSKALLGVVVAFRALFLERVWSVFGAFFGAFRAAFF